MGEEVDVDLWVGAAAAAGEEGEKEGVKEGGGVVRVPEAAGGAVTVVDHDFNWPAATTTAATAAAAAAAAIDALHLFVLVLDMHPTQFDC